MRELLDVAGVAYELDPTLVRGLDYYTRTVFEFTSDALGAQSGVGGGGRYDGLVEQLGGPADAAAWAGRPGSSGSCSPATPATAATRATGGAHPPAPAPLELFVALDGARDGAAHAPPSACSARRARRGSRRRWTSAGARSRASSATPTRSAPATSRSSPTAQTVLKDMQGGGQEQLAANAVVHAVLRGQHAL